MNKISRALVGFSFGLCFASAAAGENASLETAEPIPDTQCSASLNIQPSLWRARLDSNAVMPVDIGIERTGSCLIFLVIDYPRFQLTGKSGEIAGFISSNPASSSGSRLSIPVTNGDVRLFWRPDPVAKALAGEFSASVPMRIEDDSGNLIESFFADLSVEVDAEISVRMMETSSRNLDVDLGNIAIGTRRSVDFEVESNSPFSIETISASGGSLIHSLTDLKIPYEVSISSSGILGGHSSGRYKVGSGTLVLDINVPPVPGAAAGNYSDELTVIFRSDL